MANVLAVSDQKIGYGVGIELKAAQMVLLTVSVLFSTTVAGCSGGGSEKAAEPSDSKAQTAIVDKAGGANAEPVPDASAGAKPEMESNLDKTTVMINYVKK